MIINGTRIKLIKQIGFFANIGEICEVINISEKGAITFKCSYGFGCMPYDELEKYFVICDNTQKQKPKRKWSNWTKAQFTYIDLDGYHYVQPVEYRDNGKTVQLRTDNKEDNVKVKASCNKFDKFNIEEGLNLADKRMQIKLLQKELKEYIDNME